MPSLSSQVFADRELKTHDPSTVLAHMLASQCTWYVQHDNDLLMCRGDISECLLLACVNRRNWAVETMVRCNAVRRSVHSLGHLHCTQYSFYPIIVFSPW